MNPKKQFVEGLTTNNPVLVQQIGMCATMAITTSLFYGIGMGLSVLIILTCCNVVIAAIRKIIPGQIRLAIFVVVIAGFVTIVDLLLKAFIPALSDALGVFIPLIVVNCIILGRAEAFASKNGVIDSLADGLGAGVGFTLALALIAAVRELLGAGSLTIWGDIAIKNIHSNSIVLAILPAGGFITLGLLLALINHLGAVWARKHGEPPPLPINLDCRHCTMCPNGK